jgi:hypothetical protein
MSWGSGNPMEDDGGSIQSAVLPVGQQGKPQM